MRCAAVDAAPKVTLDATISDDRRALHRARGSMPTSATSRSRPPAIRAEPIADQESADGRLSIDLSDPDDIWIVLRLQLVRDTEFRRLYGDETDENWRSVVAGTLSVLDVGVWPVTCEGW